MVLSLSRTCLLGDKIKRDIVTLSREQDDLGLCYPIDFIMGSKVSLIGTNFQIIVVNIFNLELSNNTHYSKLWYES